MVGGGLFLVYAATQKIRNPDNPVSLPIGWLRILGWVMVVIGSLAILGGI